MAGVLREGPVGSAWFAHFDRAGAVAHVDIRGPTYRGSLTGGIKSLFRLPFKGPPLPILVLTEAAIDALSLAAIGESSVETRSMPLPAAAWGQARSPRSRRCSLILQGYRTRFLCSATDANGPGDRFADQHRSLARKIRHPVRAASASIEGGD